MATAGQTLTHHIVGIPETPRRIDSDLIVNCRSTHSSLNLLMCDLTGASSDSSAEAARYPVLPTTHEDNNPASLTQMVDTCPLLVNSQVIAPLLLLVSIDFVAALAGKRLGNIGKPGLLSMLVRGLRESGCFLRQFVHPL